MTRTFPGVRALDGVDLELRRGEVHALLGENGAGKSTLVKILAGALVPDAGEMLLEGEPLPVGSPARSRRAGVSVLHQELHLVEDLTVAENLFLGQEPVRGPFVRNGVMAREAEKILTTLGFTHSHRDRVRELGVGARQLVEAARALLGRSRVLIFDEPTAALSGAEIDHLFGVIRSLREEGLGILYVSHRLEEVFALADRLTVLRDGKLVATAEVAEIDRSTLIRWMVGRDLDEEFPRRLTLPGETVLEVSGLGSGTRFREVSFALRKGEILGLAGLVGAGRTSVGRALMGAAAITSGTMSLAGRPFAPHSPGEALDRGVGYLTEDRKGQGIFPALSVRENVVLPTLDRHLLGPFLSRKESGRAAARACEDLHVRSASLDVAISTLSGGNQQKALLARLLLHELRVLVLDEPTRGIDVGSRAEIYRIVVDLVARGLSVLILSSELPELLGLCDRIVVLSEGQVTGVLEKGEATQERILDLATPEGGGHPGRHGARH